MTLEGIPTVVECDAVVARNWIQESSWWRRKWIICSNMFAYQIIAIKCIAMQIIKIVHV